jgi:hypothetical protein
MAAADASRLFLIADRDISCACNDRSFEAATGLRMDGPGGVEPPFSESRSDVLPVRRGASASVDRDYRESCWLSGIRGAIEEVALAWGRAIPAQDRTITAIVDAKNEIFISASCISRTHALAAYVVLSNPLSIARDSTASGFLLVFRTTPRSFLSSLSLRFGR